MRRIAYLVLSGLVAACGGAIVTPSPAPRPTPTPSPTLAPTPSPAPIRLLNLLIVGDSIAEGDGSTNGGQWWKLLVNDLEARHPGLYLYPNLITKGGTGLAYAEQQVAATDLTPYRGAVAFVNVGANDGTSLLAGTVTAGDYATRYAALLSTLRNAGLRLIVSTYPEPLVDSAGSMILPIIRQAAGADLLDLWQAFHDLGAARNQALHADNVHLNDDGQIEMAQLVEAELERRGLLP